MCMAPTPSSAYHSSGGEDDSFREPVLRNLPARQIPPLAHRYNPHVIRDIKDPEDPMAQARAETLKKSNLMNKWNSFQERYTMGQDMLGQLQHYGRSGTSGGVRYIAHQYGLAPEQYTPVVLAMFTVTDKEPSVSSHAAKKARPKTPSAEELVRHSLEDFIKLSDNMCEVGAAEGKKSRLSSAVADRRETKPPAAGRDSLQIEMMRRAESMAYGEEEEEEERRQTRVQLLLPNEEVTGSAQVSYRSESSYGDESSRSVGGMSQPLSIRPDTGKKSNGPRPSSEPEVKVNNVVNMIDSITEEMTFYREKIAPEPLPGFRHPVVEVDPDAHPQTANSVPGGALARPTSPLQSDDEDDREEHHNLVQAVKLGQSSMASFSTRDMAQSPYPAPPVHLLRDTPDSAFYDHISRQSFRHDHSFELDDETRAQLDNMTPNLARARFLGHAGGAHMKRAVGGNVPAASNRPRTAPQEALQARLEYLQEVKTTTKPAPRAASHDTKEIKPQFIDESFSVKRVGGHGQSGRAYRFADRPWSRLSASTPQPAPQIEYLSIIAPKALSVSGSAAPSRMGSSMSEVQHLQPMLGNMNVSAAPRDGHDDLESDLDVPDMDDLADDLNDMEDAFSEGEAGEDKLEDHNHESDAGNYEHEGLAGEEEQEVDTGDHEQEGREDVDQKQAHEEQVVPVEVIQPDEGAVEDIETTRHHEVNEDNQVEEILDPAQLGTHDVTQLNCEAKGNKRKPDPGSSINNNNHAENSRLSQQLDNTQGIEPHEAAEAPDQVVHDLEQDALFAQTGHDGTESSLEHRTQIKRVGSARVGSAHSRVVFQDEVGRPLSSSHKVRSRPDCSQPQRSILVQSASQERPPPSAAHVQEPASQPGLTVRAYPLVHEEAEPQPHPLRQKPSLRQLLAQQPAHEPLLELRKHIHVRRGRTFSSLGPRTSSTLTKNDSSEEVTDLKVDGGQLPKRARSAGTAPAHARSTTNTSMMRRQGDMLKKVPVLPQQPSAPSIPSPYMYRLQRSASQGQYQPQLDQSARQDKSPRNYIHKVGSLRNRSVPDNLQSYLSPGTHGTQTASFSNFLYISQKPVRSSASTEPLQLPDLPVTPSGPDTPPPTEYETSDQSSHYSGPGRDSPTKQRVTRLYITHEGSSSVGRPIPEYGKAYTPEEYAEAMRIQHEAKAAVSIQKYFRGFVARTNYKYLIKDEREKKEDRQIAARHIQRAYRRHLDRTEAIYSRSQGNEMKAWGQELEKHKVAAQAVRREKARQLKERHQRNKAEAEDKLAVIGPHVEVYDPFHPRKMGPDRKVLYKAAACIQRWVRGWLIRIKIQALDRKSKQHAPTFSKLIEDYKLLLRRIQRRVGITRPSAMVHLDYLNSYMENKRRYEGCFESRAFSGELELIELMEYFNECNLYPSETEVTETLELIFRDPMFQKIDARVQATRIYEHNLEGSKLKRGRGLLKHQVLEVTFQLYPPQPDLIPERKSTWMHPIVNGQEANKYLASDNIEDTDFKTVWKLVATSMRARAEKEGDEMKQAVEEVLEARRPSSGNSSSSHTGNVKKKSVKKHSDTKKESSKGKASHKKTSSTQKKH